MTRSTWRWRVNTWHREPGRVLVSFGTGVCTPHDTLHKEHHVSHIITIQTQVRDPAASCAACERLKLPPPTEGSFSVFSAESAGHAVQLPGWRYPLVCETTSGQLRYDNYNGRWGEERHRRQPTARSLRAPKHGIRSRAPVARNASA